MKRVRTYTWPAGLVAGLVLLFVSFGIAAGQPGSEITISAALDRDTIGLDEQAVLTVQVAGQSQNLPSPEVPQIALFEVYSQGRSSSINIVNGQVNSSVMYRFLLVPSKAGTYPIDQIAVVYNNKRYSAAPVTLTVLNRGTATPPALESQAKDDGGASRDYFLEAVVDKKNPYVNEQITLTLKFYIAVQYYGSPELIEPPTTGFWTEVLGNEAPYRQVIGGRTYRVIERKYGLFPTQTGDLAIGPAAIRVTVPDRSRQSRDPFGVFNDFFNSGREVTVRSKEVPIKVRTLPTDGRPDDFGGSIGTYEIAASVDKTEVEVNQPVTLKLRITGIGNVKAAAKPPVPELEDFRIYEASSSENISRTGDRMGGTKIWEEVFIPRRPGTLEIPSIQYTYFNPERGKYETQSTKPIAIHATKPSGYTAQGDLPYSGSEMVVGADAKDIRFIKQSMGDTTRRGQVILVTPLYLVVNSLPLLVVAGLFVARKRREKLASNVGYARSLQAGKKARKRLSKARSLASVEKGLAFFAEVHQTLTSYIADKLNVSPHGLTTDRIAELLAARGADETLIGEINGVLQRCDFARFAPSSINQPDIDRTLADVEQAMIRLEGVRFA